ncbi:MAPK kinase substrate protein At1g80180-like [Euphorbia lathyris]|uniref:MAPK kinase substrate protein At1g80180-like n=1 Tax=Euphorbia lathyris TaxID=212925 RepID=UPI00331315EE
MAGLQRSTTSFRRQGSSGLVWDDKFLAQLANEKPQHDHDQDQPQENQDNLQNDLNLKPPRPISTIERSRSTGGQRGYRTGRVSPAIEPPSPRVYACGLCGAFGKPAKNHRKKAGKTRSR